MRSFLKHFGFSLSITLFALGWALFDLGVGAMLATLVLIAIEIAFSFDNAIINAKILAKMSQGWQRLFLTVGVLIAIFGMRLVFPIAIVSVAAHLPWDRVLDLALNEPEQYAHYLDAAHPTIAAFGGSFLLALVLYFFFDRRRDIRWIDRIEGPLQRLGGNWWLAPLTGLLLVAACAALPINDHAGTTLRFGVIGLVTYAAMHLFILGLERLTGQTTARHYKGWAAFMAFIYLELLDASFSFDGVLGAFAITNKVVLIALGLGVGAFWVRSLTVFMVRHSILDSYRYLEHGAHYAIAVLAVALLLSVFWHVPDALTGIIGMGIISASIISSRQFLLALRRQEKAQTHPIK